MLLVRLCVESFAVAAAHLAVFLRIAVGARIAKIDAAAFCESRMIIGDDEKKLQWDELNPKTEKRNPHIQLTATHWRRTKV